jgi:hypothetical protein
MSIAALLGVIWHLSKKKLVPFLKSNWKQISWTAFLLWIIMCILTHCSGVLNPWGHHSDPSTVSVTRDTVWIPADTNAIFVLHGFDTLPRHVRRLEKRLRFRPTPPVFRPDGDCSDSVMVLRTHSKMLELTLLECDSAFDDAVTTRTYGDTLRNDSIEVAVNFKVEGRLRGAPNIGYRYLAPYPVITETIVIRDPHIPRRQVYVGGGIGPRFLLNGNQIDAVMVNAELGYTTRKSLSIGVAGDFTHKDYGVRAVIRKGVNIGK